MSESEVRVESMFFGLPEKHKHGRGCYLLSAKIR